MIIKENTVARFYYRISDQNGEMLDDSSEGPGLTYLHGHSNILPGLEAALEGKSIDDEVEVTLPPEEAFGEKEAAAIERVPKKRLSGEKKWQPGMLANLRTDEGIKQVTIIKVGHTMATVDMNHPLAGKTVTFLLRVEAIRDASEAEIEHGHAHGPGGHQH